MHSPSTHLVPIVPSTTTFQLLLLNYKAYPCQEKMQLKLCFVLGAFTCLAVDAQNTVIAALQEASSQYTTAFARLSETRDDCEADITGIYKLCGPALVSPRINHLRHL